MQHLTIRDLMHVHRFAVWAGLVNWKRHLRAHRRVWRASRRWCKHVLLLNEEYVCRLADWPTDLHDGRFHPSKRALCFCNIQRVWRRRGAKRTQLPKLSLCVHHIGATGRALNFQGQSAKESLAGLSRRRGIIIVDIIVVHNTWKDLS